MGANPHKVRVGYTLCCGERLLSAIWIAILTMFPQSRELTAPHPSVATIWSTPSSRAISYLRFSDIIPLFLANKKPPHCFSHPKNNLSS